MAEELERLRHRNASLQMNLEEVSTVRHAVTLSRIFSKFSVTIVWVTPDFSAIAFPHVNLVGPLLVPLSH